MQEIWKDIKGYEGLYQISNFGRVKRNGNILKPIDSHGYKYVHLCNKNHERKNHAIHRLVALTFIYNPSNLPQVNHIDGDKSNNLITNLEWVTATENAYHKSRVLQKGCRPVRCIETGIEFPSINAAAKYYNRKQNVLVAVLHNYKYNHTFAGYHWKYV